MSFPGSKVSMPRSQDMPEYSDAEKLKCLMREIAMRERTYPRWIEAGKMTILQADRELAVMRAIADDYRPERLL
jgi:hypothetical protein